MSRETYNKMNKRLEAEERPFSVNSISEINIDVTDEELKKLSESFAKGREELQKVNILLPYFLMIEISYFF